MVVAAGVVVWLPGWAAGTFGGEWPRITISTRRFMPRPSEVTIGGDGVILGISGSAQTIGSESVAHDEQAHNFGGSGSGKLPVRRILSVVNGSVIGVALDPQTISRAAGACWRCGRRLGCEEDFIWAEPLSKNPTSRRLMTRPSGSRRMAISLRLISAASAVSSSACSAPDRHSPTPVPSEPSGRRGDPAKACTAFRVFDFLRGAERHRLGQINRHFGCGSLKDPHLLECDLDGQSQLSDFSLVDLRRSVEHDEKSKQQSDEIGIGNQPALVIDVSGAVACGGS